MKPLLCLLLIACVTPLRAEDKPDVTKEGKLTATLKVKDVQGGFAGFTGTLWTLEPSGKWTMSEVFNERLTEKARGELTKAQLTALVRELDRFDLDGLTSKQVGKREANPHVVTINHGKKTHTLTFGTGESLPKYDPDKPRATVEGRFSGIVEAVQKALKEK